MSTKQAAKSPAIKAVTNEASQQGGSVQATKRPRKPKVAPLSLAQRFDLMGMVKGASPTEPDSALAARASAHFGRAIQQQTIADYRKSFGLASVRKPSPKTLAIYVETLKGILAANGIEVPPVPQETAEEPAQQATGTEG